MNPKPVSVRDTVDERSIKPPIKTVLPLEKRDKTPRANPTHSDDRKDNRKKGEKSAICSTIQKIIH
jgi:hypothetical protein